VLKVTRWCIRHRRRVFIAWIAIAVITTAVASAVGRNYAQDFSLPGTESQHALDLLKNEFPAQSGDVDTIVFHTANGTVDDPAVQSAIQGLLAKVKNDPHVVSVLSPYSTDGSVEISHDRRTAFATVNYDHPANDVPNAAGKPVLDQIAAVNVPGLKIAAGGQVMENAEGFTVGPATAIGAVAAFLILLLTFGSLIAAGMPLITAGFGLITGVALIGLATQVTSIPSVSPDLALMIGLGVGVDYALFIVTRFRENFLANGDVEKSVIEAMDTSGRAILLAGTTVVIALLGMFATGVSFLYGLSISSILAVLMVLAASLTVLPAMLSRFGARVARRRGQPVVANADGHDAVTVQSRSRWRQWSRTVQARPWPLAIISLGVMIALLLPVVGLRLESSDAGNDPSGTNTRQAFDLLAQGFGQGFNGPLLILTDVPNGDASQAVPAVRDAVQHTPGVVAVTPPRLSPKGNVAVFEARRRRPWRRPTWSTTCATTSCRRSSIRPAPPSSSAASPPARSTSRTCSRRSCRCSSGSSSCCRRCCCS
jgi:putative drug exporter of the RND superfamily